MSGQEAIAKARARLATVRARLDKASAKIDKARTELAAAHAEYATEHDEYATAREAWISPVGPVDRGPGQYRPQGDKNVNEQEAIAHKALDTAAKAYDDAKARDDAHKAYVAAAHKALDTAAKAYDDAANALDAAHKAHVAATIPPDADNAYARPSP